MYILRKHICIIYVLIFFIHIIDTIYMWIIVIFARYMYNNSKTEEIVMCNKKTNSQSELWELRRRHYGITFVIINGYDEQS